MHISIVYLSVGHFFANIYAHKGNLFMTHPPNQKSPSFYNVAVVGAKGYSGLELSKLLLNHPYAKLKGLFASKDGGNLGQYFPLKNLDTFKIREVNSLLADLSSYHICFLATPANVSMELAPKLIEAGIHVIDLSGAFRLDEKDYPEWYGSIHLAKDLLEKTHYGLTPWNLLEKSSIGQNSKDKAKLMSNPGCYATSIMMALLPLLKTSFIDPMQIVIDTKSGTTGAGKKPKEGILFSEAEGECRPYKIGKHQHLPEIIKYCKSFAGVDINPMMTTHLLPIRRGIISSLYLKIDSRVKDPKKEIEKIYDEFYKEYPFISISGLMDDDGNENAHHLSLKRVVGTPHCQIVYQIEGNDLYVFSLIHQSLTENPSCPRPESPSSRPLRPL